MLYERLCMHWAFSRLTGTCHYHPCLTLMCVCCLGKSLVCSQCSIDCACRQVSFQVLPHWLLWGALRASKEDLSQPRAHVTGLLAELSRGYNEPQKLLETVILRLKTYAKRNPEHFWAPLEEFQRPNPSPGGEIKHLLLISWKRGAHSEALGSGGRPGTQGVGVCDLLECAELSWLFVLWSVLGANQAQLLCILIKIGACNYSAVTPLFLGDKSSLPYLLFLPQVISRCL